MENLVVYQPLHVIPETRKKLCIENLATVVRSCNKNFVWRVWNYIWLLDMVAKKGQHVKTCIWFNCWDLRLWQLVGLTKLSHYRFILFWIDWFLWVGPHARFAFYYFNSFCRLHDKIPNAKIPNLIPCSVVIVSYQVPRAAEAWPWPARHGQML